MHIDDSTLARFCVSQATIGNIKLRKTWGNLA